MAVRISPVGRQQFFDNQGNVAAGMLLFTYIGGSSTKLSTYTDSGGGSANSNPITLNSAGRTPNGLWLLENRLYKFVLAPANDTDPPTSPVWTEDNISASGSTLIQTIDTIALLRALAAPAVETIYQVLGYYASGDGGGGLFVWDSADTSTDDGGTIIQPNAGGTGRWNRLYSAAVDVKWFGAKGDGATNDAVAIQSATAVAQVAGGKVFFPLGAYNLGSTGITNTTGNGVLWCGEAPRFVGATLFGVEFLYSGTGVAVTVGVSGALNYRNGMDNIQIRATGGAAASATAIGLRLINTQYFSTDKSAIKDFGAGIGLQFQPAGAGCYGATNVFKELFVHLCKIAVQSNGTDAVVKDNATLFLGGAVLQNAAPAGSIGFDLKQFSDSYQFFGTDCEGFETGWKIDGANHNGISSRSEDCTTHVSFTANATTNHFVRHCNEGTGTPVTDTSTAHNSTFQGGGTTDKNFLRGTFNLKPLSDTTEVFALYKANGTVILDFSTSGTANFSYCNSPDHVGYSDNFVTRKWKITGSTGSLQGAGFVWAHDQTAMPAGGTAGAGLLMSSTASFGVFFGSGAPTLAAAKGSLYLRSDGSAVNNRAYINTDGGTTWTALTTAA